MASTPHRALWMLLTRASSTTTTTSRAAGYCSLAVTTRHSSCSRHVLPALVTTALQQQQQQQQQLPTRWFSTTNNGTGGAKDEQQKPPAEESAESKQQEQEEASSPTQESTSTKTTTAEETAAAKMQVLEQQVKDLRDQLLRSLAEQENTRRIAQRDVESARQFAIKSFAKSLLEVADNLERALTAVPEQDKQTSTVLNTLVQGIEMTDKELQKAFQLNGLVKYGKVGDVFDPNQHEALYEYVDPTKEPGTVGQVMKAGFLLHKRVLRPAEVGVVKKQ